MKRRTFVGSAGAGLLSACKEKSSPPSSANPQVRLAGTTPGELQGRCRDDLFNAVLPFWDRYGFDREFGGVMHGLDYDGTLAHSEKLLWFQGRAIWVYSFLYNNFGKDPRHLQIAAQTREFVLRHAPQPDGWWAELLARDGRILRGFQGDLYGMYFVAEGLQEYAWAAGHEESLRMALGLVKKLHRHIEDPRVAIPGTPAAGIRPAAMASMTAWKLEPRPEASTTMRFFIFSPAVHHRQPSSSHLRGLHG